MMEPKRYLIEPDAEVSDIDLKEESFTLADGSRLTEERAVQLAAETVRRRREQNLLPGRKSLARDGSHSPVVQFRSPRKEEGQAIADQLGISLSELARQAYDGYLDGVQKTRSR